MVWNISCHASLMKLVEIRSYYMNKSSAFPAVSGKWMWYKAFLSQAQETYLILLLIHVGICIFLILCWNWSQAQLSLKLKLGLSSVFILDFLGTWCGLWPVSLLPANFATQKLALVCLHLPFWQSWLLEQFRSRSFLQFHLVNIRCNLHCQQFRFLTNVFKFVFPHFHLSFFLDWFLCFVLTSSFPPLCFPCTFLSHWDCIQILEL